MVLRPGAEHQQAALEGQALRPRSRSSGARSLRCLIVHQLDADHQAQAAHVADVREARGPIAHAIHHMRAHAGGVRDQLAFEQLRWWPATPRPPPDCRRTWRRARRASNS